MNTKQAFDRAAATAQSIGSASSSRERSTTTPTASSLSLSTSSPPRRTSGRVRRSVLLFAC
jgi:hypothetical protein